MWPLRIFIGFIVLLSGFLSMQLYNLMAARADLMRVSDGYFIGPEDADLQVVMYLDFTCSYCREAYPVLLEAVKRDGKVKFSPRPVMSVNADGSTAAYMAYAAGRQGKFFEMHDFLMKNYEGLKEERLQEVSSAIGLDAEKFNSDMKAEDVGSDAKNNNQAMAGLGARGTPAIFINASSQLVFQDSIPDVEGFLEIFRKARESES